MNFNFNNIEKDKCKGNNEKFNSKQKSFNFTVLKVYVIYWFIVLNFFCCEIFEKLMVRNYTIFFVFCKRVFFYEFWNWIFAFYYSLR